MKIIFIIRGKEHECDIMQKMSVGDAAEGVLSAQWLYDKGTHTVFNARGRIVDVDTTLEELRHTSVEDAQNPIRLTVTTSYDEKDAKEEAQKLAKQTMEGQQSAHGVAYGSGAMFRITQALELPEWNPIDDIVARILDLIKQLDECKNLLCKQAEERSVFECAIAQASDFHGVRTTENLIKHVSGIWNGSVNAHRDLEQAWMAVPPTEVRQHGGTLVACIEDLARRVEVSLPLPLLQDGEPLSIGAVFIDKTKGIAFRAQTAREHIVFSDGAGQTCAILRTASSTHAQAMMSVINQLLQSRARKA